MPAIEQDRLSWFRRAPRTLRDQLRRSARSLEQRFVSRTLLVEGSEFDRALLVHECEFVDRWRPEDRAEGFYVAAGRGEDRDATGERGFKRRLQLADKGNVDVLRGMLAIFDEAVANHEGEPKLDRVVRALNRFRAATRTRAVRQALAAQPVGQASPSIVGPKLLPVESDRLDGPRRTT